ncbi:DUF4245 domain-containing protein [Asanoa sp. NPDC049573]|uniref:DUF4245 domain-containing protein n=1 Tax=Asanoa sp. NPDC049573 TaxID=3155396 RepID=UPI00341C6607
MEQQEASTERIVESAQRAERRPRDMVISLAVLLVPILLAFGIYRVFFDGHDPIRVDPAVAIDDARHAGAFPVLAPTGLDHDWTIVSATFQTVDGGKVLRFGLVSPDGEGAQVVQTDVSSTDIIPAELTRDARVQGTTEIAGSSWQTYSTRPGEHAFVKVDTDSTVIVVGGASEADLTDLAASLK